MRVACYIDGFNLYHAIADLNKPHLKWVDLSALATSLCRDGEAVVKTAYFSAYATWKPDQYSRHRQYVAALKHLGVECHISATTAGFTLPGGKYGLDISATWGGGNAQLQILSFDGSTWVNAGSSITANGYSTYDLEPGSYRLAITTATAVYAALMSINEG